MKLLYVLLLLAALIVPGHAQQRGGGRGAQTSSDATPANWSRTRNAPTIPRGRRCLRRSSARSLGDGHAEGRRGPRRPSRGISWLSLNKYTITMEGRAVGGVVMFKGTADLGAGDGGT